MPLTATAQEIIRSIHIEGTKRTEARTILRELPFAEGDSWKNEWQELAERRLRNTGLFSEAHVSAPDTDGVVNILVRERWSIWLLPTASRKDNGESTAGLTLDDYNLWGLGHHLHVSAIRNTGKNFSTNQGTTTYGFGYGWRRIGDSKLSADASASSGSSVFTTYQNGISTAQYIQDGNSSALIFSYALGPVPGEGWGVRLGYTATNTTYRLISGTPQPDVQTQRERTLVTGVSYAQVNDHITWFTGTAFDYGLSISHRALGSSYDVYSQTISFRTYVPYNEENTFNTRLNAGIVTGNVLRDALFDIGNRNGIRGYYPGEVQGTAFIYGTAEWRYLLEQGSNVQLVAFTDVGYVNNRGGKLYGQPVIAGAGTGIRWTLRWLVNGTIRGDAAYGFATHKWRFYLGTGQAF